LLAVSANREVGVDVEQENPRTEALGIASSYFYGPEFEAIRDAPLELRTATFFRYWAAKEAVLKVLGTGWRGGIAWTDIEVLREPSGQPRIILTGECLRIAGEAGITSWHISISHIETHATASAIGLRGE